MADLINEKDTLNEGRKKINRAINHADEAKQISEQADTKATEALNKSESTQEQLNQVVIDGDSSVEAAQARVDEKGQSHTTLKERIDDGFTKVNTQLAEKVDQVSFNASNQSIEFYANGILIRSVDLSEAGNAQAVQSYIDSLVSDGFIEGVTLANGAVTYEKTGFA